MSNDLSFRPIEAILQFWSLAGDFRNMANRTNVSKFGDWETDVPLTVVFEKAASKNKSKKDINMCSNPTEYPDMNRNTAQPRNYRSHDQPPNHNVRPGHERFRSREDTEFRPFTPSPAHNERNVRVKPPHLSESFNNQSYGGRTRSVGNPSEIHRRQPQPQNPGPVQSRPIPNLRNSVATIPPFPGSGSNVESYTLIFDQVKEERKLEERKPVKPFEGTTQSTPTRLTNDQHHQPLPSSPKGCFCFAWNRKRSY